MREVRTGCTEAKERSASRLRVEPPLADKKPVGRWMATAGSRRSGGLFALCVGLLQGWVWGKLNDLMGMSGSALRVNNSRKFEVCFFGINSCSMWRYWRLCLHAKAETNVSVRRSLGERKPTLVCVAEVVEFCERPMREERTKMVWAKFNYCRHRVKCKKHDRPEGGGDPQASLNTGCRWTESDWRNWA